MRFWDREKEIADLKRYLQSEPNAILFVYGPKSSGKSTLLRKVIDDLMTKDDFNKVHDVYWFDLRGKFIESYKDVIDLFFIDEDSYRKLVEKNRKLEMGFSQFFRVEQSTKVLIESRRLDPFIYMEEVLRSVEKIGVIVFDELQRLKDVYINGGRKIVDALFNFFVRLTKVLHLSHVLVMTSDTFFIEEVYSNSALKNTSRYYLVDYFDDETTLRILIDEGLSEDDARYIVEQIGGVPWIMEQVVETSDPKAAVQDLYSQTLGKLFEAVRGRDDLKNLLKRALNGENLYYEEKEIEGVKELVEREVLFFDPINRVVKFHTKLDERAARELIR